jgi:cytochrome c
LTDPQQAAFTKWYEQGHGYVGIHSATDTEYTWPWYGQLTGAYFRDHPNGTPTATVVVEDTTDPSTQGLPARWVRTDEWYNFQSNVNPVVNGGGNDYDPRNSGVHVLLKMDESTYVEGDGSDGVDDDHPISWCNRFDGGRMFYTAMGHTDTTYTEPGFVSHLLAGFQMTAGTIEDKACGKVKPTFNPSRTPAGSVDVNVPITFDSGAATVNGDTLTYAWDFGDGTTSTAKNPSHAYTAVGSYTAKVTVTSPLSFGSSTMTFPVTVTAASTANPGGVGADVPFVLSLTLGGPVALGPIIPGVAKDYTGTMAATVTSTAGEATLSVADPSATNTGKLVNGTYVLASPLQVMATNSANPTGAFAPVTGTAAPVSVLSYPRAISSDPVTVGFKQSVADSETLRAGNYGKTLVFTLSTATP